MRYRLLDLRFDERRGVIDDEPLQRLLHGHRPVEIREQFYEHDGVPHMLVAVRYELAELKSSAGGAAAHLARAGSHGAGGAAAPRHAADPGLERGATGSDADAAGPVRNAHRAGPARGKGEHWEQILQDGNHALFQTLRAWRSARARADAVPAYVILTNAQLAHLANARPTSLAGLRELRGLGESRAKAFGRELLAVIETGVVPPMDGAGREPAPDAPGTPPPVASTSGDPVHAPGEATAPDARPGEVETTVLTASEPALVP